ncbi:TIGR03086 family metal-binding protein [Saccharopolyspora karakumensis]|uniref:TIGR03086 family metal-binding protein n=1 Tax=Saccharopolyspora karakumensis TaxID=2530386 RepID=UPI001A9F91B7|nr:TIGR03086 family metal-binding protein [Saccharopolyspora karakumensis]
MQFDQQRQDYFDALAWVTALMEATTTAQLTDATPCAEYDVRALAGHLIGTAHRGLGTAEGVSTQAIPHAVTDVPDAQLAAAYAALADRIRAAWKPLRSDDQVRAPWGPCTAHTAARGFTIETVTHGWDLAIATDQPSTKLDHAAERCLPFATDVIPDRLRGVMYDDPVPGLAAASATERLAHLLGHQRQALPTRLQADAKREATSEPPG